MESKRKKRNTTVGKTASATFVLAFTMVLFLTMMFEVTKGFNTSYAAENPTDNPPATLKYSGDMFETGSYWNFMDSNGTLPLGENMRAKDDSNTEYNLYCMEAQNQVSGTDTYSNPKRVDPSYEVGLAWILQNTYPIKDDSEYMSGLSNAQKKYVTQYAIWYYLDLNNVTYLNHQTNTQSKQLTDAQKAKIDELNQRKQNGESNDEINMAAKVVKIATLANYYNQANKGAAKFGLNTSNISFTVDGDNLVSSEIAPANITNKDLIDNTYLVTLDNNVDAKLVNADGSAINGDGIYNININSTFKIVVPISKIESVAKNGKVTLNLNATATYRSIVYRYESSGQAPLIVGSYRESATATLSLPITKIEKIDAQTKKAVKGATLKISTESDSVVKEFTTGDDPYYISLQPGKYYLTETKAPDGYETSAEKKEFTVAGDGTITDVVFTNTPKTDVPNTASNIPTYIYIIGALIILAGSVVVYSVVKPKESK